MIGSLAQKSKAYLHSLQKITRYISYLWTRYVQNRLAEFAESFKLFSPKYQSQFTQFCPKIKFFGN